MQIVAPYKTGMVDTANHLGSLQQSVINSYMSGLSLPPRSSSGLSGRSGNTDAEDDSEQTDSRARPESSGSQGQGQQRYHCPLCQEIQGSQKEFTTHIRGHNEVKPHTDPNDPTGQAKVYYCCLCRKMLSSFSSLDRHMLVHSGERPFACELCGQTFTTNGNMHRHKRTHGTRDSHESDGCSSGGSGPSAAAAAVAASAGGLSSSARRGPKRKRSVEHRPNGSVSPPEADVASIPAKLMAADGDQAARMMRLLAAQQQSAAAVNIKHCPFCNDTFFNDVALETHVQTFHPMQKIKCDECPIVLPTYGHFRLHKSFYHHKSVASFPAFPSMLSELEKQKQEPEPEPDTKDHDDTMDDADAEDEEDTSALDLSPAKPPAASHTPDLTKSRDNDDSISIAESADQAVDESEGQLREMKLRGEFPCRLCPAVYPNLRALKGHNKEHLLKAPYCCNVANCAYSSSDKSTLTRHMRTHTGEKPFECKVCNFGFTTKANCERHVKNKHGKSARDEIRDAIVVHETDEVDKSSLDLSSDFVRCSPLKSKASSEKDGQKPSRLQIPPQALGKAASLFAPYSHSLFRSMHDDDTDSDKASATASIDSPLDLSRPSSEDLIKEHSRMKLDSLKDPQLSPAVEFLRMAASAAADPYAASPFGANKPFALPTFPGLGLPPAAMAQMPFLFQHLAAASAAAHQSFDLTAYILAQQEILRRQRQQQMTAAALPPTAKDATSLLLHLSSLQSNLSSKASPIPSIPSPNSIPEKSELLGDHSTPIVEKADKECEPHSDYKLVIKNGVLMKKQKQRRYRTERPYGCDFCTARFTLRSNMERHVKQQHPEHWGKFKSGLSLSSQDEAALGEDASAMKSGDEECDIDVGEEDGEHEEEEDEENLVVDMADDDEEEDGYLDIEDESEARESADSCGSDSEGGSSGGRNKTSAYASAPNKVKCPHCDRKFPWTSSLNRHILTHTGDKPHKCSECPMWFTTKSNCDRHLVRKHGNNNNEKELAKNVPERPFKCHLCLSSTFSSESKLREHIHVKHLSLSVDEAKTKDYEASADEEKKDDDHDTSKESVGSENPFKCHLCDSCFCERAEAIEHLRATHGAEYESLTAKGAFETSASEDQLAAASASDEMQMDQLRGKFPDYVNRKVVCLFCLRKFWSAEDLRRHVRTHTGERPFSCDICHRRFTLKHSMLRHRKKHDSGVSSGGEDSDAGSSASSAENNVASDEEETEHRKEEAAKPAAGDRQKLQKRANLMDTIEKLSSGKKAENA